MVKTKVNFVSRWWAACCLVGFMMVWPSPADAAKIMYHFKGWDGPPVRIFITRPVNMERDRPVVFVMHGDDRNADEYRDQWHDLADRYDFLLVVPEFSERRFPGSGNYGLGSVFDEQGNVKEESGWTYSVIEAIFDDLHSRYGLTAQAYSLFGDDEGAQFVQRFIFHVPDARVNRVVVADASWYMMPEFDVAYPYGLNGSAVDESRLAGGLQLPVTILLGAVGMNPDPYLRRTPGAMVQGSDRLSRGQAFFASARDAAARMNVPFNWNLETVEQTGTYGQLASSAVRLLLGQGY